MLDEKAILANKKTLFAMAVEDALNEAGQPWNKIVTNELLKEYKCSISDCIEHPEYLKDVLNQIFGHADIVVISKIRKNLGEFGQERSVGEFLKVLAK
jgi:hypothetical protein